MTRAFLISFLLLSLLGGACAGGGSDDLAPSPVESGNNAGSSNNNDEADMAPDMTEEEPDMTEEEPDMTEEEPDMTEEEPDMTEPEPVCDVCCAGERRCADNQTSEVCNEDGSAWESTECFGGAECSAGVCRIDCTPGETSCLDGQTQQTCDVSGASFTTVRCPTGVCFEGACQQGKNNAEACETDAECAGGECLCRGEEVCAEPLQSTFGVAGFCTVSDCSAAGCGTDEVCVDFSASGGLTGSAICIKKCFDCLDAGFICRELPTLEEGETVWQEGCFPAEYPRDNSARCESDADCLGGFCLTGEDGPRDGAGYCAQRCEDSSECASNSSCIQYGEVGNICARHCGDGEIGSGTCPINRGTFTSCQSLPEIDGVGDLTYVCLPR